jgi:hypothetical protein
MAIAATGLLGATAPLISASAAGAAVNQDTSRVSLTFVNEEGAARTCTLYGYSSRDTDTGALGLRQQSFETTNTQFIEDCVGYHLTEFSYKGPDGVVHRGTVEGFSTYQTAQTLEGVVGSNVSVRHSVVFDHCNQFESASCTVSTTTAPK